MVDKLAIRSSFGYRPRLNYVDEQNSATLLLFSRRANYNRPENKHGAKIIVDQNDTDNIL